ncbi:dTDP-4-dehydrorhamnose 3,5-epimerase [Verrucomicrobiota bacterium]
MIFTETPLQGAYLIDLDKKGDERGFFARFFCRNEFGEVGIDSDIVQINTSLTGHRGTLRGMHYQLPPKSETKVVRCVRGALHDVVLDLRPSSATFGRHFGATLTPENRTMLVCPRGFAHGFITLEEDTEVLYLVSEFYSPDAERGIRWNDPKFDIQWPMAPLHLSDKDRSWPDFDAEYHLKGLE